MKDCKNQAASHTGAHALPAGADDVAQTLSQAHPALTPTQRRDIAQHLLGRYTLHPLPKNRPQP